MLPQTNLDKIEVIEELNHPNLGRFGIGYGENGKDLVEFRVTAERTIVYPIKLADAVQWSECMGFVSSRFCILIHPGPARDRWMRSIYGIISRPRISVNAAEACELLGLNDGRSDAAKRRAFYRFRMVYDIPKLPGGGYSLKKLQDAVATAK